MKFLNKVFGFDPTKHSVKTEIMAGLTSFLTMAYILSVNPTHFPNAGMDAGAVFTVTALIGILSCTILATLAKMPFGLAPGMGSNMFFIYTVCVGMHYSWQFALTAVFIEGIIFILLTLTNIRQTIANAIPKSLQKAIGVGIGLFITFVGLQSAGIVTDNADTLVQLGNITSGTGLLAIIGLVITSLLVVLNVKGGMLLGILITTLIGVPMGITHFDGVISAPKSIAPIAFQLEWSSIFSVDMLKVVVAFFFIDFFNSTGTVVAMYPQNGFVDKDGKITNLKKVFLADAIGTTASGLLGSSAVVTFCESGSGVAQGGRTGLTSFTIAVCFFIALFFSPVFLAIPAAATAPVLIIVGLYMMSAIKEIDLADMSEAIPAFITIIMMPLAYSIADGILLGIISYVLINACTGKFKKVSVVMYILAAIFLAKYIFM